MKDEFPEAWLSLGFAGGFLVWVNLIFIFG